MSLPRQMLLALLVIALVGIAAFSLLLDKEEIHTGAAIETDAQPGVLRIGVESKLQPINPLLDGSSYSAQLCQWIFDGLLTFDANGQRIPNLAESYTISRDGTCYTISLRKDVRFHDGHSFTAADVVFTYEAYQSGLMRDGHGLENLAQIRHIRALDEYTVQFQFARQEATFLDVLAYMEVLPRHLLTTAEDRRAFGQHPIGTGPFKFSRWRRDGGVEIAANQSYHRGPPHLRSIVIKPLGNVSNAWTRFLAGDVDMLSYSGLDPSRMTREVTSVRAIQLPGLIVYSLVFNPRSPLFADIRVRRAIASLVDRRHLAGQVGVPSEPAGAIFAEEWLTESHKDTSARPDAFALLAEAGWQRVSSGWWTRGHSGFDMSLSVDGGESEAFEVALSLRQLLALCGIRVHLQCLHHTADSANAHSVPDALLVSSVLSISPTAAGVGWVKRVSRREDSVPLPEALTELFSDLSRTTDVRASRSLCARIVEMTTRQALVVPLMSPIHSEYVSRRFQGDLRGYYRSNCSAAAVLAWHVD